jgi:leucyl aminopeptidase
MPLSFAAPDPSSLPLTLLAADAFEAWCAAQPKQVQNWISASGFQASFGTCLAIAGPDGTPAQAIAGAGTAAQQARNRFALAAIRDKLPAGTYHLVSDLTGNALETEALGWLLAGYTFDRYATQKTPQAQLVCPVPAAQSRIEAIAAGEALTRTLINTPASDMGPPDLESAARSLAQTHGAGITVTTGDDLLTDNFPMIHAVGRAASRAPRLIDIRWGTSGPKLTLVGKGVCFDTGGLNLKPGASMGLMKKDMGGSAAVLGLAHMIMALGLPLQLRVLIPAVENSVDEDTPDLIISMATLTGAARVAVGPDLAPYYAQLDSTAAALEAGARRANDPVWRMPFWDPYEKMIEPGIADLDNAPSGGFAGSITAALFLRRFVTQTPNYLHFDIYGWQPSAAPARPKGGTGQATRALLDALPDLLDLPKDGPA